MNVVGRGPSSIQITHGSRHDLRLLRAGAWMRDKLLIFDLGYFQGYLFNRIGLHGGFFLSRLKQHTNPLIVATARPEHQRFIGEKLQSVVARLHGEPIARRHTPLPDSSFQVAPSYDAGESRRGMGPATQRYHLHLTNVPREKLGLEHIPAVYAARWGRSSCCSASSRPNTSRRSPQSQPAHYRVPLYASLLTLAVSRRLHKLLAPNPSRLPQRHPFDRWAVLS